jgi:glycosyltransferase involved in cell wall biosynthesis
MPHISVVSPVYQAEECLRELYRRLVPSLSTITEDFEIVLVDDGSKDKSWQVVEELGQLDNRVKGIQLSRNFGQHYAITAGLDYATGDWVVVMDCDLQDRPEEIPMLYAKAQEGYDVVLARRLSRRDGAGKKLSSVLFRVLFNRLADVRIDSSVANFSISSRNVVDNVRRFKERNRSFPLLLGVAGFTQAYLDVEHSDRYEGKSSYTWPKLLRFAADIIVSHSNRPLHAAIWSGVVVSLASFSYGIALIIRYIASGISVPGWTSTMVVLLFFCGFLLANMGLMGLYLGKVFDEVKGRPLYMVQKAINTSAVAHRRSLS